MTPPTLIALMIATVALAGCSALENENPVHPELGWTTDKENGVVEIVDVFRDTDWKWVSMRYLEGECNMHLNGRALTDGERVSKDGQPILIGDRFTFDTPCRAEFRYTEGDGGSVMLIEAT